MRHHLTDRLLILPLVGLLALGAVACGDDDSGSSGGDDGSEGRSGATGELTNVDFEGASITIGSKDFDENILLGTILATALEEAGADNFCWYRSWLGVRFRQPRPRPARQRPHPSGRDPGLIGWALRSP